MLATTGRPLTRRRHPDPGPQPRRAGVADRRPSVRGRRAGRRHRPAASAQAAGGQGPARRRPVRGPAARRPQPRQSAGFAADRLGPGPAARPGAWPQAAACGRRSSPARDEKPEFAAARELLAHDCWRWPITRPRTASSRRSCPARSTAAASFIGRLGQAARDPIEELLSSALEFERSEAASLDRFLAWFDSGDVEIKRDPSAPANAVRVMTVHGAKGWRRRS